MKNFIIALLLILSSAQFANATCSTGSCSSRRPVATALNTTKRIVVSPFKRIRTNRVARQALVNP